MVGQEVRSLLILGEVATLEEAVGRRRRVHEEVRRPVQLNDDATGIRAVGIAILQVDVLDVREGILNLVARLLVVDVVGHGALIRRVEDDEIHRVLPNTSPLANPKASAGEVVNDWSTRQKHSSQYPQSGQSKVHTYGLCSGLPRQT